MSRLQEWEPTEKNSIQLMIPISGSDPTSIPIAENNARS